MPIRFTIEQRPLSDPSGRPARHNPDAVSFHHREAASSGHAVHQFLDENGGELIGDIVNFPGYQAVATVRVVNVVYPLHVTPASQSIPPRGE